MVGIRTYGRVGIKNMKKSFKALKQVAGNWMDITTFRVVKAGGQDCNSCNSQWGASRGTQVYEDVMTLQSCRGFNPHYHAGRSWWVRGSSLTTAVDVVLLILFHSMQFWNQWHWCHWINRKHNLENPKTWAICAECRCVICPKLSCYNSTYFHWAVSSALIVKSPVIEWAKEPS